MFVLINLIISLVLSFLSFGALETIYALAVFVPSMAVSVRRLHDTERSAWWMLVGLVPFLGILVLIYFFVLDGTHGPNRFGPDPKRGARQKGYDEEDDEFDDDDDCIEVEVSDDDGRTSGGGSAAGAAAGAVAAGAVLAGGAVAVAAAGAEDEVDDKSADSDNDFDSDSGSDFDAGDFGGDD